MVSQEACRPEVDPTELAFASSREMNALSTLSAMVHAAFLNGFYRAVVRPNCARIIVSRRGTVMMSFVMMAMPFGGARGHNQSTDRD